jgi:hypothetical protein
MNKFVDRHWGDLLSLYILHIGLFIIWQAHGNTDFSHIGESLILAAVATLRFKPNVIDSLPDPGGPQK